MIPETHLRSREARALTVEVYEVVAEQSRGTKLVKMCGGVVILASVGVTCTELENAPRVALPLDSCSVMVYLRDQGMGAQKITGVYLPPKGGETSEKLAILTDRKSEVLVMGDRVGRLLVGDFNHPSWPLGYTEWTGMFGLWELYDHSVPTFPSGNSFDKFLSLPGGAAPLAFLPSGMTGGGGGRKIRRARKVITGCFTRRRQRPREFFAIIMRRR